MGSVTLASTTLNDLMQANSIVLSFHHAFCEHVFNRIVSIFMDEEFR